MCGPAIGIIGAGLSAIGSIASGQAQAAGLKAQAKFNERQAEIERDASAFEQARERDRASRLTGQQIAGFAASGVSSTSPSVADVISDSLTERELDIGAIRFGREIREGNFRFQARINRANASTARTSGFIGAASSLVSGLGRVARNSSLTSGFSTS